ncbi:MAG: glycosyl hydrolase 53 family protein [Bacteroidales bacterium]|nr:glycosyl hydrolase 53 family protein [Bacteroidales bacterium]
MIRTGFLLLSAAALFIVLQGCQKTDQEGSAKEPRFYSPDEFVMGADLSYVNQILDHGGTYRDSGKIKDPYRIFAGHGANVVRLRLFHTPRWTGEIYGEGTQPIYHHFEDVKIAIERARAEGMDVLLDFHYSDNWADPHKQNPPEAWESLDLETLRDSIYQYTFQTLEKLEEEGLMPEYVQTGNEINPGFVLPKGSRWDGNKENFVYLMNGAIQGVRDAARSSSVDPQIILHVAQPENVSNWFQGLKKAGLSDYDIIGFSYYYIWSEVPVEEVSKYVGSFRKNFGKKVMILETAYPWTTGYADDYNNISDTSKLHPDYPATPEGQKAYMQKLTQEVIDGGGQGVFYWEPAWITCNIKTQWGTGSAWEHHALFDFEGNTLPGMDYMTHSYSFEENK